MPKPGIYGGVNPADVPAYTLAEAARLVGVPASTLQKWTKGRSFPTKQGGNTTFPIITVPEAGFLSFTNVVEAHVLAGLRRQYQMKLDGIRTAVRYVEAQFSLEHALARELFKTDGVNLFIDKLGALLNVSKHGQVAMREILDGHLKRVEYDDGRAVRFFPLHPHRPEAFTIVVDPRRAFGRPTLVGTSVPISDIVSRFKCGDEVGTLAEDYQVKVQDIEEALRARLEAA